MSWSSYALENLSQNAICGYLPGQSAATEPTALAALALAGSSLPDPALKAAEWLAKIQSQEGSVGVRENAPKPRWTTALAVLVWQTVGGTSDRFADQIEKANAWSMSIFGARNKPSKYVGHQTMLSAWPWVEGTHSWLEPSALQVMALKASGHHEHPRTREAVKLLLDRQLPEGGCNFGNTTIFGKTMPPYVQSTGMALLALAGEPDPEGRITRSINYLKKTIRKQTTPASLGWGLMGLAAHGQRPAEADLWLERVASERRRGYATPIHAALLVLASQAERCPLVPSGRPAPTIASVT